MDLTPLIDLVGESGAALAIGLGVGVLFGFFAQRSRFCLRAAAIEFARASFGNRLAVWLFAFAGAAVGTQLLVLSGLLETGQVRALNARGSLSGALLGGLLFGSGMVLARGCSSRLLVLAANGNLRALLSGLVFAVTAQASLMGLLSPVRHTLAEAWTIDASSMDMIAALGLGWSGGLALALLWLAAAIVFGLRSRIGAWGWSAGLGVGLSITLAWFLTYQLNLQAFTPAPVKSMTFTGPSAATLMLVLSPPGTAVGFDTGLIPGVFVGSLLAALLFGEWKLEGFEGAAAMRRYLSGACMMGFGGMLAGGCAVGSVSSGSLFALTAWVTLLCMFIGAGVTDRLLDRGSGHSTTTPPAPFVDHTARAT